MCEDRHDRVPTIHAKVVVSQIADHSVDNNSPSRRESQRLRDTGFA